MKTLAAVVTAFLLLFFYAATPAGAFKALVAASQPAAKPSAPAHLVYDTQARRLVLLTASRQSEREQLWSWNGKQWQFIPSVGPATRELGAATYDTQRKRLVMHGGMGLETREDRRGDTWEWDGNNWREMRDTSVGTRDHHAMAYDEARGRAVLFGGNKAGERLETDTWEWDGKQWSQVRQ